MPTDTVEDIDVKGVAESAGVYTTAGLQKSLKENNADNIVGFYKSIKENLFAIFALINENLRNVGYDRQLSNNI